MGMAPKLDCYKLTLSSQFFSGSFILSKLRAFAKTCNSSEITKTKIVNIAANYKNYQLGGIALQDVHRHTLKPYVHDAQRYL